MTANFDVREIQSRPVVLPGAAVPARTAPVFATAPAYGRAAREFRFQPRRTTAYPMIGKRLLDVTLVVMALPVVLPIVALLAFFVALSGGNPIYVQDRVGRGGRSFRMFKLRTMVRDADDRLADYLAANPMARAEWNLRQKLTHDPRITAFGAFLRRTSLDELPQLFNVLRGDMSLVGPRPMMVTQRNQYPGTAYYRLRPGLTGPWQIGARHLTTFADRSIFDDQYENRHGLIYDLSILLRTVRVVATGTGC